MNTLFIVGAQRSGTTLLSVMLEQHPDILMEKRSVSFRLISAFKNAWEILPHNLSVERDEFYRWLIRNDYKGRLASLLDLEHIEQYGNIRELIEGSIERKLKEQGKIYWVDKAPNLQLFIPDLLLLIPGARVVHIVRDGRANAYSISRRSYQHLLWSAQHWVDMNVPGLINRDLLGPERYHFLHYEALLREPEETLKALCTFLELPYSSRMLELEGGEVAEEKRYVKSSLNTGMIDRYLSRMSAGQLRKVEQIQQPMLGQFGYSLHGGPEVQYRPLSLTRQIWYHQSANFKSILRSKQKGMRNRRNVEIELSWRSRIYTFLLKLGQDLLATPIVRTVFRRTFYKQRFYPQKKRKKQSGNKTVKPSNPNL